MDELTELQSQVLEGLMLGDGHLSIGGKAKNPRLRINRALSDYSYMEWIRDIFINFTTVNSLWKKDARVLNTKRYPRCCLVTRRNEAFLQTFQRWYVSKEKIIPKYVYLSPMSIAVWFADDGCVYQKRKNGITSGIELSFATAGFGKEGSEFLSSLLNERYGCGFKTYGGYRRGADYKIVCSTRAARRLLIEIDPIFTFLPRKSDVWRSKTDFLKEVPFCPSCGKDSIYRNGFYEYKGVIAQRMKCRICSYAWKMSVKDPPAQLRANKLRRVLGREVLRHHRLQRP